MLHPAADVFGFYIWIHTYYIHTYNRTYLHRFYLKQHFWPCLYRLYDKPAEIMNFTFCSVASLASHAQPPTVSRHRRLCRPNFLSN